MSGVHASSGPVGRVHMNRRLVVVIVLGAAVAALGAWAVVDRTRSSSTQDLASPGVAAMLDARLAAMNRFDAEATADVAQTFSWGSRGATDGQGILVFKLDPNGTIAHEWVIVGAP